MSGPPGVDVTIADTYWDNDERNVSATRVANTVPPEAGIPWPLERLLDADRLSVQNTGAMTYVNLQISRIRPDSPELESTLEEANPEDFDAVAGPGWNDILAAEGAIQIGTRAEIFGEKGARRSFLACTFDPLLEVPVVAYCLTRILPLLDVWSPVHPERPRVRHRRRVYVVELSDEAGSRGVSGHPNVYVGETSRSTEQRLATHLAGGQTSSSKVRRFATQLLPELYEHVPPVEGEDGRDTERRVAIVERWLAAQLRDMGYTTHGGERGLDEALFRTSPPASQPAIDQS